MSTRVKKNNRKNSMFWKPIPWGSATQNQTVNPVVVSTPAINQTGSFLQGTHSLVNQERNTYLREYENKTKQGFDEIQTVLADIVKNSQMSDFANKANRTLMNRLGVELSTEEWMSVVGTQPTIAVQKLFSKVVFKQYLKLSKDFYLNDPLDGQIVDEATQILKDAGVHALGIAPCADGRLSHFISYVIRMPYALSRRKAHAGALFDVSESVRNWVFVEHTRFRDGVPNRADEPTQYMKMAVYHFSKSDPSHQGCAAHGSDDEKAAQAALEKLVDFKQAIQNRFGHNSTVETVLVGVNTDDDSIKLHVPDRFGQLSLTRYVDSNELYNSTLPLDVEQSQAAILSSVEECAGYNHSSNETNGLHKFYAWMLKNNFAQIEYVNQFEDGCYSDIGHAERFICVGSGFEEIQLRNLSYFSFLNTIEEGVNDIDVGIKIFKGLNVKHGKPIPIIICCEFDGRVPGSKERASEKAQRIENAIHSRFQELSGCNMISTMMVLRDHTGFLPVEQLDD